MAEDTYMVDGSAYCLRRHATFSANRGGMCRETTAWPPFQTMTFNPLNGGIQRQFAPVRDEICSHRVMREILALGSQTFGAILPLVNWHVEIHQFRILAQEDGGKPTPEGMYRDGVDFVLMTFIGRSNVSGGETTVQDMDGNEIARFTLAQTMETVMLNDLRVAHGVTRSSRQGRARVGIGTCWSSLSNVNRQCDRQSARDIYSDTTENKQCPSNTLPSSSPSPGWPSSSPVPISRSLPAIDC
ncbi:MAG: 2OG-Fe dioxygenase family protein [Hyphomicrobiales bacterium]